MTPLRICLIASSRFPICEPFAGGMEAHTHALARELIRRGHDITLYAAAGTDPSLGARTLEVASFAASTQARADVAVSSDGWMEDHHAYLALLLDLSREAPSTFDIIHNNSLHHLPIAMAAAVPVPMVTTLHTPPVAWLESALRFAPSHSRFVAVSDHVGRAWRHVVSSRTIANGVDTDLWAPGPGGGGAVWSGRIVPEKAPHLAIDAARAAGLAIELAGPVFDHAYFADHIEPRLGGDVRLLGHLSQRELATVVGRARVAIVTPAWDEPYGLVAAEAMSCGTPVAAIRRGAMSEVVGKTAGRLAEPGDVPGLARAVLEAAALSRNEVRAWACRHHGLSRMVDEYEDFYRTVRLRGAA
ncbi:glycosyltransferase [Nocardioides sp. Iso805N]|uniref:glycosyltransferase n=1 Tax=Nocardioides sp. Iso805N TaxID=1283287 RepID=UPI0003639347|nr:glycosyltransferase [Nocardioides sp. Iso805N]